MPDSPSSASSASTADRIVRASVAVGIAHICFKLVGLAQSIIVGRYLESELFDVIYVFAFEGIIWSIFFRLGEETIGPAFLPVFMEEKDLRGERQAWRLANVVLTLQALLLVLVVGLIIAFPDQVIQLSTFWNKEVDQDKYALARESLIWIAPTLIGLSLGSTTYMILNGYKRFFLAAFGETSWKICVLVFLVVGMSWFELGYRALLLGLLVGGAAKLITHLCGLIKELRFVRPSFDIRHPALRTLGWLMLPMILGTVFSICRDFFNNVAVLSYIDTDGLMKANSFGRKLFVAIGWMVPYTVSIAMFPFFCEMVDKKDVARLGKSIEEACRSLCALFIPGALIIAVLSQPIALALFEGGEFSARDARWAAISNACYILVLPAYSLEYVFMQGYFANRRMWAVIGIGVVFSMFSVGVSYVCIVLLGMEDIQALMAVALGYTVSRTLKTVTLATLLKRVVPMLPLVPTVVFLLRSLLVGVICAAVALGISLGLAQVFDDGTAKLVLLTRVALALAGAGLCFFLCAWLFRLREPFTMIQWGLQKVRAKFNRA